MFLYHWAMPLSDELPLCDMCSECEKTEETLLTSWYPAVTNVFSQKNITNGLKVEYHRPRKYQKPTGKAARLTLDHKIACTSTNIIQ